jgi:nucleoside-diphosphate-sugar epimerase
MAAFTIQDVSRRSGHRRYSGEDVDTLQMLACLRAMGMGVEDMRTYQANRARGREAAAEQRDLLLRHAERVEAQIETLRNPTGIFGPSLVTEVRSTLQLIAAMLDGAMTVVPRQRFGVADVRDVADAHIRAMATPAAASQRFLVIADGPTISWLQLARILRDRLGPLAERVPAEEAPGAELPDLVIHNERAKRVLGWRPRPAETTIAETAKSLRDLGLLQRRAS